jgi:hypothetical protein
MIGEKLWNEWATEARIGSVLDTKVHEDLMEANN